MPWRVQATWTVGDEERSYAPQFVRTRLGAALLKRQMQRTLAHFPTLEVVVEKASAEAPIAPAPPAMNEPLHLIHAIDAATTACGLQTADVAAVAVIDMFELSGSRCASCQAATRD